MIEAFIDGANLYATIKALKASNKDIGEIDFKKLYDIFVAMSGTAKLFRLNYYTAVLPEGQQSTIIPLLDWLDYNGFKVIKKNAKEYIDASGRSKIKGNMDCEIAVDMLTASRPDAQLWLFSGDGDFSYLIKRCQQLGAHVTVCSTFVTQPSFVADELRRSADVFVDVASLNIFKKSQWS